MTLTPSQISFIKGIGIVVVVSILTYLGDAAHLNGIVSPVIATLIAALASSYEAHLREQTGAALFGAVRAR